MKAMHVDESKLLIDHEDEKNESNSGLRKSVQPLRFAHTGIPVST
jgi:hypothetical protein